MAEEKKNGVSVKKSHSQGCEKAQVVSRLETLYKEEIVPALMKEFGYKSIMECPKLVKIILNMRLGEAGGNEKNVEEAVKGWKSSPVSILSSPKRRSPSLTSSSVKALLSVSRSL